MNPQMDHLQEKENMGHKKTLFRNIETGLLNSYGYELDGNSHEAHEGDSHQSCNKHCDP